MFKIIINTIATLLVFVGIVMMAGSAGDCDGKCVEIANTYSVKQPSETPIKVKKHKEESYRYNWNSNERQKYMTTRTEIERVDE